MRPIFAFLTCTLMLALATPPLGALPKKAVTAATPVAPVQGILLKMIKAEDTPTGTISVVDDTGKETPYQVNESTIFQIVQGTSVRGSSFLREHRGEMAKVFAVPGSNPATAAKVQIVLPPPPPPPPPPYVPPAPPGPPQPNVPRLVNGVVTSVAPLGMVNTITIRLYGPPPPIVGTVTDVTVNPDNQTGTATLQVGTKTEKFTITPGTQFHKQKGHHHFQAGSFLSLDKGQTVVLFHYPHHSHVATKVDIMANMAYATHHAAHFHHHHHVTFLTFADTTYGKVRNGHHSPATLADVLVGEHVSIRPTGTPSHLAKHVEIHLPHTISGTLTGVTATGIQVNVHHANKPDTVATVALASGTVTQTVDYKTVRTKVALGALHTGERVVVFPTGVPPHPAEMVEIHLPAPRPISSAGKLVGMGSGTLTVSVHHAAKDGKPAVTVPQTYQLTPTTKIELVKGKNVEAGNLALLSGAKNVTVHGKTGTSPPTAERVEIPLRGVTLNAKILGAGPGGLMLSVHNPKKDGLAVADTLQTFQLTPNTRVEHIRGKERDPGTAAQLQPGREVIIHGWSGALSMADRIEIRPLPPPPKKKK